MFNFGRKTMEWDDFTKTAEWVVLNDQSQTFVRVYLETCDGPFAFSQAYSVGHSGNSSEVARTKSYSALRRRVISNAINRYLMKTEAEILRDEIEKERRSTSRKPLATRLKALEMKAQLLGIKLPALDSNDEPEAQAPAETKNQNPEASALPYDPARKYKVGDLFVYEGCVVRTAEVNDAGVPTKADRAMELSR